MSQSHLNQERSQRLKETLERPNSSSLLFNILNVSFHVEKESWHFSDISDSSKFMEATPTADLEIALGCLICSCSWESNEKLGYMKTNRVINIGI